MCSLIFVLLTGCVSGNLKGGGDTGRLSDTEQPSSGGWVDLSLSSRFGCALDAGGIAACSGIVGGYGSPIGYEPDESLHNIATSYATGCGLREDQTPLCFGYADEEHFENIILIPAPGDRMRSLASGSVTLCGVRAEDGRAVCWGSDVFGVPGNEPEDSFVSLSQSLYGVCGVTVEGGISCWGDAKEPINDPPDGTFVSLDQGGVVGVAINTSGRLVPWGHDIYALWDVPEGSFVQVAVGAWTEGMHLELGESTMSGHACAINKEAELVCWGDDRYGATDAPALGKGWTDVDANGLATCGIHSGQIHCWGTMLAGQVLPPE
jgi:hypothetical protein